MDELSQDLSEQPRSISRRRVLQGAAVAGGAIWAAPVVDSFLTPAAAASAPTSGTLVPFGASGWTYQLTTGTGSGATTTGSVSTGTAPFGTPTCTAGCPTSPYDTVVTNLPSEGASGNGVRISRSVTTAAGTLEVQVVVDDDVYVYVDGNLIGSYASGSCATSRGPYTVSVAAGTHSVVILAPNSDGPGSGDCAFVDASISLS